MGCCVGRPEVAEPNELQIDDGGKAANHSGPSLEAETSFPKPQLEAPTTFVSLTMPQASPDIPPRPEFTPFTVAHACASNSFDGKDFWTYPERSGWIVHTKDTHCHVLCPPGTCHHGMSLGELFEDDKRRVRPPIFSRSDGSRVLASDKVAFLQAWLFFGVLKEVSDLCGLEIDVATEFIIDNGLVSTAGLNGLPERWFKAAIKTGRAGDTVLMERILTVARHSYLMLSEELADENTQMFKYTYAECRVLHSLEIVVRIIGLHLLLHIYMPEFTATEEEGWGQDRVSKCLDWSGRDSEGMDQLSDLARDELEEQGWCESELDLLAPEDLAFASLLSRPRIRDHSKCGDVICNAYQTDEATYQTRHIDDGCNCDFVGVETNSLVAALAEGKVPKLVITEELGIRVVSEDDYPYIALSHVWADGLGNAKSNALPRCQLRRLRDYAIHLYHVHDPTSTLSTLPIAFWMDTLCIPVDPNAKVYRKRAIQLLGKTFHEAVAVLILDRELEIVNSVTASFLELGLRILCSGWVKRLWTLQEATLAGEARGAVKLYFQMHDGPFLYEKYDRDRKALRSLDGRTTELQAEERYFLLDKGVMLELGTQIPSVRAMRDMREGWSPFRVIYSAIEHRSTSKFEDVPVCIASLLGKDLSSIVSASDPEQRMANFYMLMGKVPIGVLWSERSAKLSIAPFRWAPKSITGCPQTAYMGWEEAPCDASGLHVKLGGFVLAESEVERHGLGIMLPQAFNVISADTGEVFCQLRWPSGRTKQIPLQRDLALIFRPLDRGAQAMDPNALVVVIEETIKSVSDDGTHSMEFVCRIVDYLYAFPPGKPQENEFRGYQTAANQKWCIT